MKQCDGRDGRCDEKCNTRAKEQVHAGDSGSNDEGGADDEKSAQNDVGVCICNSVEDGVIRNDTVEAAEKCAHGHDDEEKGDGA